MFWGYTMRNLIYFIIMAFSVFFLASCSNKTEYVITATNAETFYDINYEMKFENETFDVLIELKPKLEFDAKDIEIELSVFLRVYYTNQIQVIEKNRIYKADENNLLRVRESIDDDVVHIEFYEITVKNASGTIQSSKEFEIMERTYQIPSLEPYPLWFSIEHPSRNVEIYNEIEQKLTLFNKDENQLDIEVTTYLNMNDGNDDLELFYTQQILLQESPYYVDVIMGETHEIITSVNQRIMLITLSPESYRDGVFYYNPIDIGEIDFEEVSPTIDTQFNPETMRFSRLNNRLYHFITKASDFLTLSDLEGVNDTELVKDILNQAYVQGQIEFSTKEVNISYILYYQQQEIEMEMMISMTFKIGDFTPIDFDNDTSYQIQMPTSIEQAILVSPLDTELTGVMEGNGLYFRFDLEPGTYVIHSENHNLSMMHFKTYNADYEEVYLGILDDKTSASSLGIPHEHLLIRDAGTYYIRASSTYYLSEFEFKLSELGWDSYDIEHGKYVTESGNYSFEINNKFDFYTFVFDTDEIIGVKIKGENVPSFIKKSYLYANVERFFGFSGTYYVLLNANHPYLTFYDSSVIDGKEFSLQLEIITAEHSTEINLSDMEEITEVYHPKTIFAGPSLGKNYMKLIVLEEARYQLEFEENYGFINGRLLGENRQFLANFQSNSYFDLQPGSYILEFGMNYDFIGTVRYQKIDLNIQVISHTLVDVESPNIINQTLPRVSGKLQTSKDRIYYEFSVIEESFVMVDTKHALFDDQYNKISFDKLPYGNAVIYKLNPGIYRVLAKTDYNYFPYDYSIILARVSQPFIDDSHFGETITNAYLNVSYSLTSNYQGDMDVLKLVVTQAGNYRFFSNMQIYICNDNRVYFDTIFDLWDGDLVTLTPGTYYLTNRPASNQTWTLRITA